MSDNGDRTTDVTSANGSLTDVPLPAFLDLLARDVVAWLLEKQSHRVAA